MDVITYALLNKKLQNKADLVDGKIPVDQLPEEIGSGKLYELEMQLTRYYNNLVIKWGEGYRDRTPFAQTLDDDYITLKVRFYESNFELIKETLNPFIEQLNTTYLLNIPQIEEPDDLVSILNDNLTKTGVGMPILYGISQLADKSLVYYSYNSIPVYSIISNFGFLGSFSGTDSWQTNIFYSSEYEFEAGSIDECAYDLNNSCILNEYGSSSSGEWGEINSLIESTIQYTLTAEDVDLATATSSNLDLTSSGQEKVLPLFQKARELSADNKLGLMTMKIKAFDLEMNLPLTYISGSDTLGIYENFQIISVDTSLVLSTEAFIENVQFLAQILSNGLPIDVTVNFYKKEMICSDDNEDSIRILYHIEVEDSNNDKTIIPIYKDDFDRYLVEMNQVGQQMATAQGLPWTTLNTIDDVKNLFDAQKSTQYASGCDLAMNLLVKYAYESGENPVLQKANLTYPIDVIVDYDLSNNNLGSIFSQFYIEGWVNETWFKNSPLTTNEAITIDQDATFTYTVKEEQLNNTSNKGLYKHSIKFGTVGAEGQSYINFLSTSPLAYSAQSLFELLNETINNSNFLIPITAGWGDSALTTTEVFNYTMSAVMISQDEFELRIAGYPSLSINTSDLDNVIYHDISMIELSTNFSDTVTPIVVSGSGKSSKEFIDLGTLNADATDYNKGVQAMSFDITDKLDLSFQDITNLTTVQKLLNRLNNLSISSIININYNNDSTEKLIFNTNISSVKLVSFWPAYLSTIMCDFGTLDDYNVKLQIEFETDDISEPITTHIYATLFLYKETINVSNLYQDNELKKYLICCFDSSRGRSILYNLSNDVYKYIHDGGNNYLMRSKWYNVSSDAFYWNYLYEYYYSLNNPIERTKNLEIELVLNSDTEWSLSPSVNSSITILTSDWVSDSSIAPYTYKAVVNSNIQYLIAQQNNHNIAISLFKDPSNVINFATYDFIIGNLEAHSGDGTTDVTVYSKGLPSSDVTLKVITLK